MRDWGAPLSVLAMNDICDCIMDCGLHDIGFSGLPFTWQWKDGKQRLDRFLFNQSWLDTFNLSSVFHGVRRCSDHRPLVLFASIQTPVRASPFKFQNMWISHPACLANIKMHWNFPARHTGIKKFWEKLQ